MKCSHIFITLRYLIVVINGYGVIAYNCENLKEPIGMLSLGDYEYSEEHNENGAVIVTSLERNGGK